MLPLYNAGGSIFHRANAVLKIAVLVVFALIVSCLSNRFAFLAALALTLAAYRVAQLPVRAVTCALRPAIPFLIVLAGVQSALVDISAAAQFSIRACAFILAAALVTYTTKTSDMIEEIAAALAPLRHFGVSPPKVGLALALTIRFIPSMMQEYREVQAARVARGGRRYSALALGPVILSAVRMADEVGDAITARGFEERDHDER